MCLLSASLVLLHISSLITVIPMLCILAAHINIFTVSVLPSSRVFFIIFLGGTNSLQQSTQTWKGAPSFSLITVYILFFALLTPLTSFEHKTTYTLSLLTFPLSLCCQGGWIKDPLLAKGDLFCDLFLSYMAWVNMFPSERYILWNKKTKPSRFLLLLMLFYF